MGYRGPCSRFRAADFEGNNRFAGAARLERCGTKFCRVTHRLDVERDDTGGVVASKVIEKVGQFQIGFVARRHELRKADAACGCAGQ
jgi:hypothetical protein